MVTIVDFVPRQNSGGEIFHVLILEGDLEMVRSTETGKFYATAQRASVTSTFSEAVCQKLIGKELDGKISKVKCDPYEYTIPETEEVITLNHRFEYLTEDEQENKELESEVFQDVKSKQLA